MMWIEEQSTGDEDPQRFVQTATSNMFDQTEHVHNQVAGTGDAPSVYDAGVLPYTQAVDETVGGIQTPGNLLGWSDGVLSRAQKWLGLGGMVLLPPRTAMLQAGKVYGKIGTSNASQNLLLGTEYQEVSSLLPDAATIAASYTHGGGN